MSPKYKKIRVLLDPQIFYKQNYGGISRIFSEFWYICNTRREDVEIVCPLYYSENSHLKEKKLLPQNFSFLHEKTFFGKKIIKALFKRISKLKTIIRLKRQNFDIFIPTYYEDYFINYLDKKPYVLSVFDMIHELFPDFAKGNELLIKQKKKLSIKSDAIVAISKSTKQDIINFYPELDIGKINVVYLSHSIECKILLNLEWLPKKYILFIGNRNDYKRFDIFLKAVAIALNKTDDVYILCAGGGKFTEKEKEQIKLYEINDKIIQYNFKEDELYTLYHNAIAFVFPSEYEGFGIPVLESMASGCATILCNSSSLPEVGGNAATYFEKNNIEDLKNCMQRIIIDDIYRLDKIKLGYEQVKKFSWDKTTDAYISIIKKLIHIEQG